MRVWEKKIIWVGISNRSMKGAADQEANLHRPNFSSVGVRNACRLQLSPSRSLRFDDALSRKFFVGVQTQTTYGNPRPGCNFYKACSTRRASIKAHKQLNYFLAKLKTIAGSRLRSITSLTILYKSLPSPCCLVGFFAPKAFFPSLTACSSGVT